MTSQTPEELEAEHADQTEQLLDAIVSYTNDWDAMTAAAAPAVAAIRRHAAAQALRAQADRLSKKRAAYLANAAQPMFAGTPMADSYRDFAQQAGNDAWMLRTAADDVIAEGWEHTCAQTTPATREDPAGGCETPVENEGDYCPRHEPADDYDPREDD
jgi:hypothetical protein